MNKDAFIEQSVIQLTGTTYKLMAGGFNQTAVEPPLAMTFHSLKIVGGTPLGSGSDGEHESKADHDRSVRVGEIAGVILGLAGVAYFRNRKSKNRPLTGPNV